MQKVGKLEKFWSLLSKLASQFDITSGVGAVPLLRNRSSISPVMFGYLVTLCHTRPDKAKWPLSSLNPNSSAFPILDLVWLRISVR